MPLAITTDGSQTITEATTSSGVVCLSGIPSGAIVNLEITMSNSENVPLRGSKLQHGTNVVTHGQGATLQATCSGADASTDLTLDFYPI